MVIKIKNAQWNINCNQMKIPFIKIISAKTKKFNLDLLDSVPSFSKTSGQLIKKNQIIYFGTVIPIIMHHDVVNARVINKVMMYPSFTIKSCLKK
jgi:hypothetical protein